MGRCVFLLCTLSLLQRITLGQGLDDDRWHTVWMKRRAQIVEMRLDNSTAFQEMLEDAPDVVLHVDKAYFGSDTKSQQLDPNGDAADTSGAVQLSKARVARRALRRAAKHVIEPAAPKNFRGEMQQFLFNEKPFFDMIRTSGFRTARTNADLRTADDQVSHPVTFRTTAAYLTTTLRLYGTFTIYFRLKTTQPDGLLLFSGAGDDKDFLALELVDGKLKYVFNLGSGPRVVKANLRRNINDNKWHQVALVRHTLQTHMLRVDDTVAYDNLPDGSSVHFDTPPVFYIGGVSRQMYKLLPEKVKSREGFQGCLGSLDIDGDSRNILEHHRSDVPDEYKDDVLVGCEGPKTECSETSCANGGICIQQWDTFTCDCDMTSFTGPRCEQDGIAYSFGSSGGLIHFAYADNQLHNTKRDQLALGFITKQKDAVLARIDSRGSEDYIEMELVDGNIFVVYNMGTMDHPIGQLFDRVDDGEYHVVRFYRNGANASIELDDTAPQYKNPSGSQLTIFNKLGDIYIGGRRDKEGRIVRPFVGTIAGFVLNGNSVLEKAAEGDARVSIEGDVQLLIQPLHRHPSVTAEPPTSPVIVTPLPKDMSTLGMQSTMGVKTTPKGTGVSDDIMFINPDCEEVDVEDCPDPDPNAFISPTVTLKPTKKYPTVSSADDTEEPCQPDDEDCLTGSGSGFIGEPVSTPRTEEQTERERERQIDIDIDRPAVPGRTTTDTPKIIIDVNMTERPLRPDTRRPLMTPTPTPPGAGGPGGVGVGNILDQDDSGLDPLKRGGTALGMNIGLIVGIAVGVVLLLLIIAFAFYKYKSRDEGSYKIDESKNYSYETCSTKPPPQVNGGVSKSGSNCSKSKKNVKEWYV